LHGNAGRYDTARTVLPWLHGLNKFRSQKKTLLINPSKEKATAKQHHGVVSLSLSLSLSFFLSIYLSLSQLPPYYYGLWYQNLSR
jgi:hypothetical protein